MLGRSRIRVLLQQAFAAIMEIPKIAKGLQWFPLLRVLAVMLLAATLLALREISALLTRAEVRGLPSAGMDALTGWHWPPGNSADIVEALRTWAGSDANPGPASWIRWHLEVDFFFALLYGLVLGWLLLKNRRLSLRWLALPLALVLVDWLENGITWTVVHRGLVRPGLAEPVAGRVPPPDGLTTDLASALAVVTDLKWVLAAMTVVVLVAWMEFDWPRWAAAVSALRAPVITVGLLAFLLVVPGGGALDQLPDILRAQADEETLASWLTSWPTICVGLFAAAVWLAGWVAATIEPPDVICRPPHRVRRFLIQVVLLFVVSLAAWWVLRDGRWPTWSCRRGWPDWGCPSNWPGVLVTKGILVLPALLAGAAALAWFVRSLGGPSEALSQLARRLRGNRDFSDLGPSQRQDVGLGGRVVAAIVVGIGGLAMVRTFVGSTLTPAPANKASALALPWLGLELSATQWWLGVGLVATLLGPALAWLAFGVLDRVLGLDGARPGAGGVEAATGAEVLAARPKVVGLSSALLAVGVLACSILAAWPDKAEPLGAHGVVILVLAVATLAAVLVDTSAYLSLRTGPIARALGFRTRPIFLTMLAVFVLAGQFDDEVRYHAARLHAPPGYTVPAPRASWTERSQQATLAAELERWVKAATSCPELQPATREGRRVSSVPAAVPLVLVASQGGGIRAAYWTANAMAELQRFTCDARWIFAASGVSGGSVGLATWAVAPQTVAENIKAMSRSGPLAQNMAAMLLRDVPRGFTGVHFGWRDRAAVFEDAWADAAAKRPAADQRAPGVPLLDRHFGSLGPQDEEWSPHLILSGTDLQRGCRVVATTFPLPVTAPAVRKPGTSEPVDPASCSASPEEGSTAAGFANGTLDVRQLEDQEPCAPPSPPHLRISTAAHLSARFPLVSPTGGLVVCRGDDQREAIQVQVGDGGYRDNTGLTALLDLWSRLEPQVAEHNRTVAAQTAEATADANVYLVPFFVLLDNHYRSKARRAALERTPEIQVIPQGAQARNHPSSEGVLEQQVAVAATGPVPGVNSGPCPMLKRWFVLAPRTKPEPSAPLGWVLSNQSRDTLDGQLNGQLKELNLEKALTPAEVRRQISPETCGKAS